MKVLNLDVTNLTDWQEFEAFHSTNSSLLYELARNRKDLKWVYQQLGGTIPKRKYVSTKTKDKSAEG